MTGLFLTVSLCLLATVWAQEQCVFHTEDQSYAIWWTWEDDKHDGPRMVFYLIVTPWTSQPFWSGISFGEDMNDMDIILVRAIPQANQVFVEDAYSISRNYPLEDQQNDVTILYAAFANGQLHVQFARPIVTGDRHDKDLDGCIRFNFPYSGGRLDGINFISKHWKTPLHLDLCDLDKCIIR